MGKINRISFEIVTAGIYAAYVYRENSYIPKRYYIRNAEKFMGWVAKITAAKMRFSADFWN